MSRDLHDLFGPEQIDARYRQAKPRPEKDLALDLIDCYKGIEAFSTDYVVDIPPLLADRIREDLDLDMQLLIDHTLAAMPRIDEWYEIYPQMLYRPLISLLQERGLEKVVLDFSRYSRVDSAAHGLEGTPGKPLSVSCLLPSLKGRDETHKLGMNASHCTITSIGKVRNIGVNAKDTTFILSGFKGIALSNMENCSIYLNDIDDFDDTLRDYEHDDAWFTLDCASEGERREIMIPKYAGFFARLHNKLFIPEGDGWEEVTLDPDVPYLF